MIKESSSHEGLSKNTYVNDRERFYARLSTVLFGANLKSILWHSTSALESAEQHNYCIGEGFLSFNHLK